MITKEFIKDLKKADNVSIRILDDTATLTTCIKEKVNHKTGWMKPEIKTEHNGFKATLPSGFTKAWFWDSYKGLYGFQALQYLIKPGDEVSFSVEVNNNGYLDKAMIPAEAWSAENAKYHSTYHNLYHEVLQARIVRNNKVIVQRLHIGDQISVDNSARMLS
jgi:hypothetical protein